MSNDPAGEASSPIVEVEFSVSDSTYPFVAVSGIEECTFELAEMVPRGSDRYAEFFNVVDGDPDRIVDALTACEVADVTLIDEYERGGFFEFEVIGICPAVRLVELGALLRDVRSTDGDGSIVAEIPPQYDSAALVESFLEDTARTELVSKREKETMHPMFTSSIPQQLLRSRLTARQRELLEAAYETGYYEWPRECTGEEMAEAFDIASATFSEHIRAAERNLLTALFEGPYSRNSDE